MTSVRWLWIYAGAMFLFVAIHSYVVERQLSRAEHRIRDVEIVSEANYEKRLIVDELSQNIVDIHWQLEDSLPFGDRLDLLEEDIDVCHARVDDVFWALEVVSRVEGPRARAPSVTKRVRP